MKLTFLSSAFAISMVLFSSCSKDENSTTPAPTTNNNGSGSITVDSSPQLKATIGGSSVSIIADGTTIGEVFSNDLVLNTNGVPSEKKANTSFYDNNTSLDKFSMKLGTMTYIGGMSAPDADFRAFFNTGTRSYSVNAVNGVELKWYDASGVEWSTSLGTGNQTGSLFTISSKKELNSGYVIMKILATFNCKLYNATGQTKTLTGGTLVMSFENS